MVHGTKLIAITVNWNRMDDTLECLDSLLQSGADPSSIIVVDNGSTDRSVEAVRKRVPSAEIIEMGENLGYIKGANRGILRALERGTQLILLINNDATMDQGALKALMDASDRHATAGILGPKILYYGGDTIWYAGGVFNGRWGYSTHPGMDKKDDGSGKESRVDFVTGCVMLVRSEVFGEVGLFDESLWMYAEDLDFCLKASWHGWESWYIPSAVAYHKVSASSGVRGSNEMTPMRSYYYARNMMMLVHRLPSKKGAFTRHLGQLIIRLPFYLSRIAQQRVRGGTIAYIRGLIDGLIWILRGSADIS